MRVLGMFIPDWKEKTIHESSPVMRGASVKFSKECKHYIPSQFFKDVPYGSEINGVRCENLECLTFPDESIDIHVTQDVIEHVFDHGRVFKEIARTLKPGGVHIFTVPIVNKHKPSRPRAIIDEDGHVRHLAPPVYHGNPLSEDGSLVTMDWGFDICRLIFEQSGLFTHVVQIDDLGNGIRAEYIEVLATLKPDTQC